MTNKEYPLKEGMDPTTMLEVVGSNMSSWSEKDLRKWDELVCRDEKARAVGDVMAYARVLWELHKLYGKHHLRSHPLPWERLTPVIGPNGEFLRLAVKE